LTLTDVVRLRWVTQCGIWLRKSDGGSLRKDQREMPGMGPAIDPAAAGQDSSALKNEVGGILAEGSE
jgi:hypothetical protein